MSPQLKTLVAYQLNRTWMRRIPYLSKVSKYVIQHISLLLGSCCVAQNEGFGENFKLYILNQGSVARTKIRGDRKIALLYPGAVWGEEHLLLNAWFLLTPNSAR